LITDLKKRAPTVAPRPSISALLALGFRPFFLLAGLFATLVVPLWLVVFTGLVRLPTSVPPSMWHAHEMVFGFTGAVIAGFLLTAVRNWTNLPTPSGAPLAGLTLLWIAGRFGMALDGSSSRWIAALLDLPFFPAVALAIAGPIVKARNWRNAGFVALLTLLFAANLLFHLGGPGWQGQASRLAVHVVILIITVVGGRVIPSFTENALKVQATRRRALDWAAFVAVAGMAALSLVPESLLPRSSQVGGGLAIAAGLSQAARMLGWRSAATAGHPILWVLHAGYAWIAVGLVLTGLATLLDGWNATAPLHALTVGAIGMLTLGMMSRVALGHTGRMLLVARAVGVAYGLLLLATIVRALLPLVAPQAYTAEIVVSGALWSAAFGVFSAVYFPVLVSPRVDGKPG
jgi:uncharacterized protein involved in response to NO